MPTLKLIEENSNSCPTTSGSTTGVGLPLLLVGAVGVIAIAGIAYVAKEKKPGV